MDPVPVLLYAVHRAALCAVLRSCMTGHRMCRGGCAMLRFKWTQDSSLFSTVQRITAWHSIAQHSTAQWKTHDRSCMGCMAAMRLGWGGIMCHGCTSAMWTVLCCAALCKCTYTSTDSDHHAAAVLQSVMGCATAPNHCCGLHAVVTWTSLAVPCMNRAQQTRGEGNAWCYGLCMECAWLHGRCMAAWGLSPGAYQPAKRRAL